MRTVALIAAYNERRFIDPCLRHLKRHGVDAYLIDNGSTDDTVELAERHLGHGLIGIESFPRGDGDVYDWLGLLQRKSELAQELEADWFIHLDPDEIRLPPAGQSGQTLREALEHVDQQGYNAVDFAEFTFVPTWEQPDHDHPEFQETLRTYYPFAPPRTPHKLNAWKASTEARLESGGHRVSFPGLRAYPRQFQMKHYLFLSVPHAIEKYVERQYSSIEVEKGWHGWRATLAGDDIHLPSESELNTVHGEAEPDPTNPRRVHILDTHVGPS